VIEFSVQSTTHSLDALAQDIARGLAADQPVIVPEGDVLAFEFVRKALDLRAILP
jgi:hypothetical protein